jgi:hypothetical protein
MIMLCYQALFKPTREGAFPDFEWGITQGDTEAEADQMAAGRSR